MFRQWSPCLFLLLISPALATRTWWMDATCKQYFKVEDFDKMMEDVFKTASMGGKRMSRNPDQEPQAYEIFRTLFNYDPASRDPTSEIYFDTFKDNWGQARGLPTWSKQVGTGSDEANRKASDIRIYCDEDARFEPRGDTTPRFDGEEPNSKRNDIKKEWWDPINKRLAGNPGCKYNAIRTDGKVTFASTYGLHAKIAPVKGDDAENWDRQTMTICNVWLKQKNRFNTMSEVALSSGWPRYKALVPPDALTSVGSMLMLHEMHHFRDYRATDYAYGWKNCLQLAAGKAIANADTFALFGVMMHALDKKFKLDNKAEGTWIRDKTIPDSPKKKRGIWSCQDQLRVGAKTGLKCREFSA
ncbi:hypothetical protein BU25DRAFT_414708 [Macroventuria anomochaeta]|uniref:Uncharacterized protein n=1 Tax=Macroventuria anomochaeta TaxID=301207 RepID=A0ACB6RMD2_9PLEO|nr:uncharacterized protein BU25DRAFT_414708 [Macroventuria anomochaeta]KAF2622939.1 hypothetical protein BU25DRAFT_414708 [Macroventuria anomochaeta]